ncbi:uncharacterized protein LOC112350187 [Selaginella moellendorffii]|uniref:uncharacterized protein LOC112350187 n=1 Tax=Selaginella moellendorffii TaxID=88036 RepID=UPI000D1C56A9|nr:uncharacterized protein LOC112350187 [Selaginella moellendorffii]|eukprot:XP_024541726.1 uncharacterized protein LOC112350187 [Selaginella moellendorffii]
MFSFFFLFIFDTREQKKHLLDLCSDETTRSGHCCCCISSSPWPAAGCLHPQITSFPLRLSSPALISLEIILPISLSFSRSSCFIHLFLALYLPLDRCCCYGCCIATRHPVRCWSSSSGDGGIVVFQQQQPPIRIREGGGDEPSRSPTSWWRLQEQEAGLVTG